jgi:catechol 2,3-dioxygenase-like lactoylglutathione lyase family enzyme
MSLAAMSGASRSRHEARPDIGVSNMILGIHHTAIATRDIESLSAWYCDMFGLTKLCDDGWSGAPELDKIVGLPNSAARFMLLSGGNHCVELFQFDSPDPGEHTPFRPVSKPGFTHICFAVDDIEGEYRRLSEAGMEFHCAPTVAADRPLLATYGRDPDGNVVELLQVIDEGPFAFATTQPVWKAAIRGV